MSPIALRARPDLGSLPRAVPMPSIFVRSRAAAPVQTNLVATMAIRIGEPASGWPEEPRIVRTGPAKGRPVLDVAALRSMMAPFGLACIFGLYPARLLARDHRAELEALRPHLDLLRAVGSRTLVLAETSVAIHADIDRPLSTRPVLRPEAWSAFGARLTMLADAVASEGITLAYHHHMGTVVQSRADIVALMTHTGPSVRLLLDTGHAAWAGADPAELARTYAQRVAHIHASDLRAEIADRAGADDWSVRRAVLEGIFTVPGDGVVDYGRVFAALPRYEGLVVIQAEQDIEAGNSLDLAEAGWRHLRQVLVETGHMRPGPTG